MTVLMYVGPSYNSDKVFYQITHGRLCCFTSCNYDICVVLPKSIIHLIFSQQTILMSMFIDITVVHFASRNDDNGDVCLQWILMAVSVKHTIYTIFVFLGSQWDFGNIEYWTQFSYQWRSSFAQGRSSENKLLVTAWATGNSDNRWRLVLLRG